LIRPIQYLRALAAMMVVWLHARYIIPGVADQLGAPYFGGAGVDLFFIISGFIMVVNTAEKDMTPAEFFCLRIVRVAPLYWVATLALIACAASGQFSENHRYPPIAIAKSLLFIPYTAIAGVPGSVWPILNQGWTLNYEMFFYALFALSLAAPRRFRIPGLALTLGLLVAIGRRFGPFSSPVATVYTSAILLEFVAGMILAYGWLRDGARAWLPQSLLLVVFGVYGLGASHSWLTVMSGAFIIVACCLHPRICAIQNRPLLELGDASYSIYLSHQFVLAGLAWSWLRVFPLATWTSSVLFMALALLICAMAGWLCYRIIERPLTSQLRGLVKKSAPHVGGKLRLRNGPAHSDP
jgi:exopolysaccharide production protein ExoZ